MFADHQFFEYNRRWREQNPNDCWCWEVPAGGLHDHQGSLEALARHELAQEIGATCDELVYVNWFYGANSVLNKVCHVLPARGTRLDHQPEREETEFITWRMNREPVGPAHDRG